MNFNYSEIEVELPAGYTDPEGKLHKAVLIREMTGEEEDLLLNPEVAKQGNTLNRILDRICKLRDLPSVKFVDSLLMVDQMFLLVKARALSFGNDYKFSISCGSCKEKSAITVKLDSLKFVGPENPSIYEEIKLEKSGLSFRFKKNQGKDQGMLNKIAESKSNEKITQILEFRTAEIKDADGNVLDKSVIRKLPMADRKSLREAMASSEGEAETKIDYECIHCSFLNKIQLPFDEDFFCLAPNREA